MKDEINEYTLTINKQMFTKKIFKNFHNKDLFKKILSIKNKIFRKYCYENLDTFKGQWRELNIQSGIGILNENNFVFQGKIENGYKIGKITNKTHKTEFNGQFVENFPDEGFGSIFYENNIYEGIWHEAVFNGKIFNVSLKDCVFEGTIFSQDPINGKGKFVKDEKLYQGEWDNTNGEGTISSIYDLGILFDGKWSFANDLVGRGTILEDKNKYSGEWSKEIGEGTIESHKGDIWHGSWDYYFWPLTGSGTFFSSNLITYCGEWINGIGSGKAYSGIENKYIYIGNWNKYGQFTDGYGNVIDLENKVFEGKWHNGNGKGTIIFSNQEKIECEWDLDRRITKGIGTYYDFDNRKYVGEIIDGIGNGIIFSMNSFIFKGTWDVNGIPIEGDGIFIYQGLIFKGKWVESRGIGYIFS
jgi:hypothetical protein